MIYLLLCHTLLQVAKPWNSFDSNCKVSSTGAHIFLHDWANLIIFVFWKPKTAIEWIFKINFSTFDYTIHIRKTRKKRKIYKIKYQKKSQSIFLLVFRPIEYFRLILIHKCGNAALLIFGFIFLFLFLTERSHPFTFHLTFMTCNCCGAV